MTLISFFIAYLLFLLASSILITAFYCITRGYTEILPDGTVNKYGKILKGYYFFWFREKGKERYYYTDDELVTLTEQFTRYYRDSISWPGDPFQPGSIKSLICQASFTEAVPMLRKKLEVGFEVTPIDYNRVSVAVYQEYPLYVFPEWLRTVMAGCITCTPTVYGNIVFWTTVLLLRHDVLQHTLLAGFQNPVAGILLLWIAYWISLAWLNTVLWNIYNK